MPKQMQNLVRTFEYEAKQGVLLSEAGEQARILLGAHHAILHFSKLSYLYEMAFLRIFITWEMFLENAFVRYLCGFQSSTGRVVITAAAGGYSRTIREATLKLLAGQDYVLWYNPQKVIQRSQRFFNGGPHEIVIASAISTLTHMANIRHRIAHSQEDARTKFDQATLHFNGQRYRGSRPGYFLRDWDSSRIPPCRWLESLSEQLVSLAAQVVP
jgi:hypothetical protein